MFSYETQPWQDVKGTVFVAKIWFVWSQQITNKLTAIFSYTEKRFLGKHLEIRLWTVKSSLCFLQTIPTSKMGRKDINKNPWQQLASYSGEDH